MADYKVHKATRDVEYGPYDPLDFELEPAINKDITFGPGVVADSFPSNTLMGAKPVNLAAMSRNKPK